MVTSWKSLTRWARRGRRHASLAADRRGLTVVELLIVMAMIGALAAIAFPIWADITQRANVTPATRHFLSRFESAAPIFFAPPVFSASSSQ